MQKEYKNHKEVPSKYKWDLSFLLEGKTVEKNFEELKKIQDKLIKIKDSKYESSKAYLEAMKIEKDFELRVNKISNYVSNNLSLDVTSSHFLDLEQKMQYQFHQFFLELGSEDTRFFKNSSKLSKWAKLPEFKSLKHSIEKKLEEKKHQLPDAIQEFRIKESRADVNLITPFSTLTDSELDYGYATTSKGKKIKITEGNYAVLFKHEDKNVRKTTSQNYNDAYIKHKATLSNILYQHKKVESVHASLRQFPSAVEYLIFSDRVNDRFLQTLFASVQEHTYIFSKKSKWHKKFYKARFKEPMTRYDGHVELANVKTEYTVDEAIDIVKKSLKPFGKEYNDILDKGFKENWVDFMPFQNKRSGAYSIGQSFGVDKKLILMSFDGTLRGVETLAHEFGHSMHSYFSDKNNAIENASYPIFLAEIASIFNELMVYDYLLENSKDDKLKFSIRSSMATGFVGTVFRQVEWANYEYDFYKKVDAGVPLGSYEAIKELYISNAKKYSFESKKEYSDRDVVRAYSVPHFYYGFYVYKYAIGQLVANIFFQKYKDEGKKALEQYIDKFLSAGERLNPLDILKDSGVDLENPESYKIGFASAEKNVEEWIKLGRKIFKI